jgi:hypothetical protein
MCETKAQSSPVDLSDILPSALRGPVKEICRKCEDAGYGDIARWVISQLSDYII